MIIISHKTAFQFWRAYRASVDPYRIKDAQQAFASPSPSSKEALAELERLGFAPSEKTPVDLLFFGRDARMKTVWARPHAILDELPRGSLVQLSDHVAIVSPELCFVQMAGICTREQTVLVGFELCGTYAQLGSKRTLAERSHLTSVKQIGAILRKLPRTHTSRAAAALAFVLDGAASPMEAKLAMLLTLPTSWGGYALPQPRMNVPIQLGEAASTVYPRSHCRADLFWPDARFDVEYDGEEFHEGDAHAKDVARLAALAMEDITVLEVAWAQVADPAKFHGVATVVARKLGQRLRIRRDDFVVRCTHLREQLELA